MITSAIKKQTSVYCSISFNPYVVFLKPGITDKKSKKESNSIVSLLLMSAATTNRCHYQSLFYMRTLSLTIKV